VLTVGVLKAYARVSAVGLMGILDIVAVPTLLTKVSEPGSALPASLIIRRPQARVAAAMRVGESAPLGCHGRARVVDLRRVRLLDPPDS